MPAKPVWGYDAQGKDAKVGGVFALDANIIHEFAILHVDN
jgi:hypothetical protein